MTNKLIYISLFFACNTTLFAQTIKGKIQNELKETISANILIKNSENNFLISEFFKNEDDGNFNIVLKKKYSKILFEITSIGYQKISDSIINPSYDKIYTFNYTMLKKVNELEEVIIKKERFKINEDTVSFNPSSYKDGTERKVEDIIKKLPGMEVDGNGTIKYRGRKVTVVQLEGDDLFGNNYAIGTRNISVDMVQQIQAINNYSQNPLLKGIENSEDVSINIKLKKGKFDISGDGNISSGVNSEINAQNDLGLNLLGISKKYKSFQNISYNNIGSNKSSEDYFGMSTNLDDAQNEEFIAKKAIPANNNSSNFDQQRANINNQLAISHNSIYRFTKKIALKINVSFIDDKIYNLEKNNSFFNTQSINYNDTSEKITKPENKQLELKLTYNTTKVSLLEVETTLQKEKINSTNSIAQNQTSFFNTNLNTENLFWKNKLLYTYKLSNNKALQFISQFSINTIPQEMNINQTTFSFGGDLQKSEFDKNYLSNKIILLGSSKKIKYFFNLASIIENNTLNSNLSQNNSITIPNFENKFNYKKTTLYTEIGTTYILKKWKFQPKLKLSSIYQNYESRLEPISKNKNSLVVIPNINISYDFNNKSTLNLSGNYEEKTPNEENLFTNYIAENNRALKQNILNLDLQQNQNYTLNYRFNDLFSSFATNFSIIYDNKKNTYLSSVEIQNDYSIYTLFQSPTNIENYFLNFGIEKYFDFIKTTIKHTSIYGINNYKNIVNQSDIRNNQSLSYNAYFYISTGFRLPINFQNKFNYSTTSIKSHNQNSNTNISLNNNFKVLIKPSKFWLFTFNYEYYLPNTKNSDNFTFLDFEIKYKPQRTKWIEFWLTGKNLLNNKYLSQTENTDFQTTTYQSSLIPRYYLLTLDFKL